jgi:hypothetical protein
MKKVILTLTGMLMFGVMCVNAQTDSVNQTTPEHPSMQQPSQESTQYSAGQRVRVPASQVPTSLRQTLKGSQYSGWENSTIYLDKSTNEYSLDMMDNNNLKTYRFDQNGKAISDKSSIKTDVPPSPESPANDGSSSSPVVK